MVANDFLDSVKAFTEATLGDIVLPVRAQSAEEPAVGRAAAVYKMRLPDSTSAFKKAPYIIHSVISTTDSQQEGTRTESALALRSVFCVYCDDEQEGALILLELIDRFRIGVLQQRVLDRRYEIDLRQKFESTIYAAEDTAPYYLGEILSWWKMPTIEREVAQWLQK